MVDSRAKTRNSNQSNTLNMENGNYPAFPGMYENRDNSIAYEPGLTKREYFAAIAMQGMINGDSVPPDIAGEDWDMQKMAEYSIKAADALLEELEKPTPMKK